MTAHTYSNPNRANGRNNIVSVKSKSNKPLKANLGAPASRRPVFPEIRIDLIAGEMPNAALSFGALLLLFIEPRSGGLN